MEILRNSSAVGLQILRSERTDTITSAQVLLACKYFNTGLKNKWKMEARLLEDQIESSGGIRVYAGWGHDANFCDMPTTEATCMALLALHETHANDPRVQVGLSSLRKNAIRCLRDEGWGILPGDVSRVHTTCLALRTLHEYDKTNTYEYERGLNWLINAQNMDKGWGSKPGDASDITYTSRVIITLLTVGYNSNNEYVRTAVQYLKSQTKGLWQTRSNIKFEYHESIEFRGRRLTFYHMPVQAVLIALLLSGNAKSYILSRGVNDLIKYNHEHFWTHPAFNSGTRKTLWAIFDTHQACSVHDGQPFKIPPTIDIP